MNESLLPLDDIQRDREVAIRWANGCRHSQLQADYHLSHAAVFGSVQSGIKTLLAEVERAKQSKDAVLVNRSDLLVLIESAESACSDYCLDKDTLAVAKQVRALMQSRGAEQANGQVRARIIGALERLGSVYAELGYNAGREAAAVTADDILRYVAGSRG